MAIQTLNDESPLGNGRLPRNPRPNSLRVDGRFSIDKTEFGVQVPSLWGYRQDLGDGFFYVYHATWIDQKGVPNVSPLAKSSNAPPSDQLSTFTYRLVVNRRDDPLSGQFWEVPGAFYDTGKQAWGNLTARYAGPRPAKWDSPITRSTFTPDLFPIAQSNFATGFAVRFELPNQGPPQVGFEWPPTFNDFWLDQL